MKDVFDYLEEEDLLRNLPEALPQMEDETAAKRIEKMALEKLQAEAKQQKKWQKRRILIAAVCCLVAVGAFARKPIAAYFQRILHYLPVSGFISMIQTRKFMRCRLITLCRRRTACVWS